MKKTLVSSVFALIATATMAQAPAFPGAEGFGRYTTGGRGGKIIHVTNLKDDGSTGSLRWALSQSGKKTIVFDVGGVIELTKDLNISGNTTILGQTAPGEGITLRYYTVGYSGDNIIVRFIRFRRGEERNVNDGADATWTRNKRNIILDHCSMSWSIDEVASFYDNRDFTMQWCTIAEALNNAGHDKGAHGYGGIWGGKGASFHHNLLAHLNNRSPRFNGARYAWDGYDATKYDNTVMGERVDFRNCVIYNWGTGGCYGGPGGGFINMVNNYYKAGPGTKTKNRVTQCTISNSGNSDKNHPEMYNMMSRYFISGNYVDGYGKDYDWKGVITDNGKFSFTDAKNFYGEGNGAVIDIKLTEPSESGTVTTHDAETAFEKVCNYAGASLHRDAQDIRYAEEATNGTAIFTGSVTGRAGILDVVADQGGYILGDGSRPTGFDTDKDGMPDDWESENGLDPENASDATTYTIDPVKYYTNIEVYANSLVQDIMIDGNSNATEEVKDYYPAYTRANGVKVEAINKPGGDKPGEGEVASGTLTWTFDAATLGSATVSGDIAPYIASSDVTMGSNLSFNGTKDVNGVTMSQIKSAGKQSTASADNCLSFNLTTADGYKFQPTNLAFKISRIGTDSGVFDLVWKGGDSTTPMETGAAINRNDAPHGYYTDYSKPILTAQAAEGINSMQVYIIGANAGKATGVAEVVITGKIISQTTDGISDISNGSIVSTTYYNMQGMMVNNVQKGTYIRVVKYADGKQATSKISIK